MKRRKLRELNKQNGDNLIGIRVIVRDYIFGTYVNQNISGCKGIIERDKSSGKYGIKIDGKTNKASSYGVFWLYPEFFDVIQEEREEFAMAKLTGFDRVAVIKKGCNTYHFAIYDDNFIYLPGDMVFTTGSGDQIGIIDEIITPEEAAQRFNKNITAEVVCKIDTSAYDRRFENRKKATEMKKKMDDMIKQMDETNKYEVYAERNPELKELLESYKKLTC